MGEQSAWDQLQSLMDPSGTWDPRAVDVKLLEAVRLECGDPPYESRKPFLDGVYIVRGRIGEWSWQGRPLAVRVQENESDKQHYAVLPSLPFESYWRVDQETFQHAEWCGPWSPPEPDEGDRD